MLVYTAVQLHHLSAHFFPLLWAACQNSVKRTHVFFDLTCDVTRDPEVNKICFPSTAFFQGFQMPLEFLESVQ